jgi:hypothetical protein
VAKSEIQERIAKLNTQLRFGKLQPALIEAYRLRTYIQLGGTRTEEASRELKRVEQVIAELEGKRASGIQKLVNSLVRIVRASLNPTEVESGETLLDRIAKAEYAQAEQEEQSQEDEPDEPDEPESTYS